MIHSNTDTSGSNTDASDSNTDTTNSCKLVIQWFSQQWHEWIKHWYPWIKHRHHWFSQTLTPVNHSNIDTSDSLIHLKPVENHSNILCLIRMLCLKIFIKLSTGKNIESHKPLYMKDLWMKVKMLWTVRLSDLTVRSSFPAQTDKAGCRDEGKHGDKIHHTW